MSAVAQAPPLDQRETVLLLQIRFPGWYVSVKGGRWTATGRHEADDGLTLEGDSAGELAMGLIWFDTRAEARFLL